MTSVGAVKEWDPARHDVSELTGLLHRAYKVLSDAGLRYLASHQDDVVTASRIAAPKRCFVIDEPELLATVTIAPPGFRLGGAHTGGDWYQRQDVALFSQLAVLPEWRSRGLGRLLVEHAEWFARELGAEELSMDTSEHAHHLVAWYQSMGFEIVDQVDWEITNYRSLILSKRL